MSTTIPNPSVVVPSREALLAAFKGMDVSQIQTPHLIVNRDIFVSNCRRMRDSVEALGWDFRAHLKTHKTAEGSRLQCLETGTKKAIISTLPEGHCILDAGLIQDGTINDVLYSMPFPLGLFGPLSRLRQQYAAHGATLRIMVDHPEQIYRLSNAVELSGRRGEVWSVYVKLDIGQPRAGVPAKSDLMRELITAILTTPCTSLYGCYTHSGFAYASRDGQMAVDYLAQEVRGANEGAKVAYEIAKTLGDDLFDGLRIRGLRLAVGSTPTAHAAGPAWTAARRLAGIEEKDLVGEIELHAGCYCLLDAQHCATSLIAEDDCAMRVGTTVISTYAQRQETLCDAGGICMSKDRGPMPGFGPVVASSAGTVDKWHLQRISQEHGILAHRNALHEPPNSWMASPGIGDYLHIIPQHACLTAAQHPWFFIVDKSWTEVIDIWVPCKGW